MPDAPAFAKPRYELARIEVEPCVDAALLDFLRDRLEQLERARELLGEDALSETGKGKHLP